MRLPVVIFKVPLDSDKDITASCFSHDTCCFRCKSVSHLPKAWPHYYGWLNPSVIKARVALFEIMLIFLPSCRLGPPVQQRFQYRIALESVIGHIWMPLLERLTFGRQNIPVIEYSVKMGCWKFHSQLIPLEKRSRTNQVFQHSQFKGGREGRGLTFSTSASRRINWSRGPQVHDATAAFSCQGRKHLLLFGICLSCLVHLWEKKETWATEPGWKANGNATLIKSKWQMYFCGLTKPFGVLAFAMYDKKAEKVL